MGASPCKPAWTTPLSLALWTFGDSAERKRERAFPRHQKVVCDVAFLPKGFLLCAVALDLVCARRRSVGGFAGASGTDRRVV
jgi:hypothetical protein